MVFTQPSYLRYYYKKTSSEVHKDLVRLKAALPMKSVKAVGPVKPVKEAVAVKSVIQHVRYLILRMQDGYEEFTWAYYSSSVDAVCLLYAFLLSGVHKEAFMINAVTAAQIAVVVKNFV